MTQRARIFRFTYLTRKKPEKPLMEFSLYAPPPGELKVMRDFLMEKNRFCFSL